MTENSKDNMIAWFCAACCFVQMGMFWSHTVDTGHAGLTRKSETLEYMIGENRTLINKNMRLAEENKKLLERVAKP